MPMKWLGFGCSRVLKYFETTNIDRVIRPRVYLLDSLIIHSLLAVNNDAFSRDALDCSYLSSPVLFPRRGSLLLDPERLVVYRNRCGSNGSQFASLV
jgi:hypothetical protein